jgi:hypothetical protein
VPPSILASIDILDHFEKPILGINALDLDPFRNVDKLLVGDECLWESLDEVKLPGFPLVDKDIDQKQTDDGPLCCGRVGLIEVTSLNLLASIQIPASLVFVELVSEDAPLPGQSPNSCENRSAFLQARLLDELEVSIVPLILNLHLYCSFELLKVQLMHQLMIVEGVRIIGGSIGKERIIIMVRLFLKSKDGLCTEHLCRGW